MVVTRRTSQSIRVTRSRCSLAFRGGGDQGHVHVPYLRVGRRREMHGVSIGSTTTADTQVVHVPHRPSIRVTRVSSSLAFHVGGDQGHQHVPYVRVGCRREMQQQLGKDKLPSVVLPPSLKSFEGVDLLVKTNTMGTQHSRKSIANSDPSTPTYSGHLNSTPDSETTLPLPTPMQQSLDRFIFRQPKLCPRRRWDVHSCKWIRPAFTFIDDDYPGNMVIN
jgi:hypothetical protein